MKKITLTLSMILILIYLSGCTPTRIWTSSPPFTTVENQLFRAELLPLSDDKNFMSQFRLLVWNRSGKDLEIDWASTRFIHNGRNHGRFIFEGLDENTVNNPPADIVPAGDRLMKVIAPVRLLAVKPLRSDVRQTTNFSAGPLPEGENGIALVIRQNEQVIRETLTVKIRVAVK